jgi:hypothetical protein
MEAIEACASRRPASTVLSLGGRANGGGVGRWRKDLAGRPHSRLGCRPTLMVEAGLGTVD